MQAAISPIIDKIEGSVHLAHVSKSAHEVPSVHSVWRTSILFTILTAAVLGIGYPMLVTAIAAVMFPHQASGNLMMKEGQIIGSELIAQSFTTDKYFHSRPSAAGSGYDATSSGGTNLAQSNAKLVQRIQNDIDALQAQNPGRGVPIDMVTTSGSGLDPDVTPDNANYQAARVAKARNIPEEQVRTLISQRTTRRDLGFLGEPRVNVLELNLALDQISK